MAASTNTASGHNYPIEELFSFLSEFVRAAARENIDLPHAAEYVKRLPLPARSHFAAVLPYIDSSDPVAFSAALDVARNQQTLDLRNGAAPMPPHEILEAILIWFSSPPPACPCGCAHLFLDLRDGRYVLVLSGAAPGPESVSALAAADRRPFRFSPDPLLEDVFCLLDDLRTVSIRSGFGSREAARHVLADCRGNTSLLRPALASALSLCRGDLWWVHKHTLRRAWRASCLADPVAAAALDWLLVLDLWQPVPFTAVCRDCRCRIV